MSLSLMQCYNNISLVNEYKLNMAKVVAQKVKSCGCCGTQTLHLKNAKRMSWLMHLFLTICTFSLWLWIWLLLLIWHTFAKPLTAMSNRWVCSKCGH